MTIQKLITGQEDEPKQRTHPLQSSQGSASGTLTCSRRSAVQFDSAAVCGVPPATSTFLDDIQLFSESGVAIRLLRRSPAAIQQELFAATAALAKAGVPLRSIWQLDELVTIENFSLIVLSLQENRQLSSVVQVILVMAEHWIEVNPPALAMLATIGRSARIPTFTT